jgi:hypothetical protein
MTLDQFSGAVILVLFVAAIVAIRRRRGWRGLRGGGYPGPGAAGAIYDMLNDERRRAIEIIAEERAGERDRETADGNLPDLERPGRQRTPGGSGRPLGRASSLAGPVPVDEPS